MQGADGSRRAPQPMGGLAHGRGVAVGHQGAERRPGSPGVPSRKLTTIRVSSSPSGSISRQLLEQVVVEEVVQGRRLSRRSREGRDLRPGPARDPAGEGGVDVTGPDGLGQEVVHPGGEAPFAVGVAGAGGHGDDGRVASRALPAPDLARWR